jgi:hypothetical protein
MNEIFRRWKLESPKLFKKITSLFIALGAIGTTILATEQYLPPYASAIAPHLIVAGIVGAAISKLTVKNPNQI